MAVKFDAFWFQKQQGIDSDEEEKTEKTEDGEAEAAAKSGSDASGSESESSEEVYIFIFLHFYQHIVNSIYDKYVFVFFSILISSYYLIFTYAYSSFISHLV